MATTSCHPFTEILSWILVRTGCGRSRSRLQVDGLGLRWRIRQEDTQVHVEVLFNTHQDRRGALPPPSRVGSPRPYSAPATFMRREAMTVSGIGSWMERETMGKWSIDGVRHGVPFRVRLGCGRCGRSANVCHTPQSANTLNH
jgi:hypothetical protein